MKRRKKAGGYNLRKSLAWDKAFLTEEGVLNDSELSLITGTIGDPEIPDCLSAIDQQGRDSVDKSSNKLHPSNSLKKTASHGEVPSSPMASASQKRPLNTGTRKNFTRSSKIPKVPISRKTSCVPSMTPLHSSSGGSSLKCTEIAQSASKNTLSFNSQLKTKHICGGAKLLESTPNTVKHSANIRNNTPNSNVPLHSLTNHKAEYTTKASKCSEVKSSQDTVGANTIKYSDGKISTTAIYNVDNAGLNKKEVQGTKPSGLRLPSPSLRFFSESKAPVSSSSLQVNNTQPNLRKSNVPTLKNPKVADHVHDFKPTQISHGVPNVDPMGKRGMFLQKKYNCSTSSNVAPKECATEMQVKRNQKIAELRVQQKEKNSDPTNDKHCKDKGTNSFQVELKESSSKATILFHDTRTTDRSMLQDSLECFPELKVTEAFKKNTGAQTQPFGDDVFTSLVTNIDVNPEQTNLNRAHMKMMLDSEGDMSSSILDDDKIPHESVGCMLDQTCRQKTMEVQLDERNSVGERSSVKLEYDHSDVQECAQDLENIQSITRNCNANFSVVVGSKYEHSDFKKGDDIFDSKLSTMNLSEGSELQDKAVENFDNQERNSTNHENEDDRNVCTVSAEVVEQSGHRSSTSPKVFNEDLDEFVHLCKQDQAEEQFQCASSLDVTIACDQSTEKAEHNYKEEDKQQVSDNSLLAKEMMLQDNNGYDIDKDNSCKEDVEEEIDFLSCVPNTANNYILQTNHLDTQSFEPRSEDTEEFSCQENKHELPPRDVLSTNLEVVIESDEAKSRIVPTETKMQSSGVNDSLADVSAAKMEDGDDGHKITKQKTSDQKLTKPPSNVVPFSDEWLAAIESAGEEILTLKTGAVKNSPPDKSIPEPSPWSPVKKKSNQMIGPFDCTKYTNL